MSRKEFEEGLTKLINVNSMESASDTPDYILAGYLMRCLDAWNCAQSDRQHWYRKPPSKTVATWEPVKTPNPSQQLCMSCSGTGEITSFQDGTFSPGPSSASVRCQRCKGTGMVKVPPPYREPVKEAKCTCGNCDGYGSALRHEGREARLRKKYAPCRTGMSMNNICDEWAPR